jgi:hypothetical protein
MPIFSYLFWPNPGAISTEKFLVVLIGCCLLVFLSLVLRFWRKRQTDAMIRRLSASWARAALWFGCIGIVLIVSRSEGIQFIAMRFLWIVWGVALLLYILFQIQRFRTRYYQVVPQKKEADPREKYLPKPKKGK